MANQEKRKETDATTEEKIKDAARKVFTLKGYAATRTRDIAEEAGINLALLNYYFRSKERLFQLIMAEKLQQFFGVIFPIVNNDGLTLEEKIKILSENYITLLVKNPDLPSFILGEIRTNPEGFKDKINVNKLFKNSSLINQLQQRRPEIEPVHFITTLLGMIVFPFIARPILFADNPDFNNLMEERKKLVVSWSKAILKT